ncbi:F-box DNA helicase 1-like [Centruroides vittatus]|uniref:F-box DNA helicase 1-like n=1 Tax=Centruroides vittatus TaxID=120091 RepID=UPI0035106828
MDRKRKRIRMDLIDCASFSTSEEGSVALTNPQSVSKTSKDPNRGMYPRSTRKSSFATTFMSLNKTQDITKNVSLNQNTCNFMTGREFYNKISSKANDAKRKRSSKSSPQKNTLLSYFQPTQKAEREQSPVKNVPKRDNDDVIDITENSGENNHSIEICDDDDDLWDNFSLNVKNDCDLVPVDGDDDFNDIYGMLGTDNLCEEEGTNYFELLPTHVFELILCQLPFIDLIVTCKRVSKHWNEVISNSKFIPWKKRYFQIKSGKCEEVKKEIKDACIKFEMDSVSNCLPGLIKYMKTFNHIPSSDMLNNLKRHEKYNWAEDLLMERVPECVNNNKELNPWCVVTALIITSKTIWDIYNILKVLLNCKSQCPVPDVLECLYCIGTFLFYFKIAYKINHGLHYRVFYALYAYENQWKGQKDDIKTLSQESIGQQSMIRYGNLRNIKYTHEQMRIINHEIKQDQIVKIIAFAGTGKTSTLIEYTRLRPHMKFLNVMFNKSVCDYAKTCFPCNVECRTAHSLAWTKIGKKYANKLVSKIKPLDIITLLKTKPESVHKYHYARVVLNTIETFMNSADLYITTAHVSSYQQTDPNEINILSHKDMLNAADDAEYLWNKMKDKNSPVHIVHDVYLKLYQLSQPDLSFYDCILIDEAQDCNGAMLDFLLKQPCPKILVGDPHQQIYGFRGAKNALEEVNCTHTYYLTQSFRFGPEIAYVASCILEVTKQISNKTLVGGIQSGCITGKSEGQICIIARTNLNLLNEVIRLCCIQELRSDEPRSIHGHLNGGIKAYNLDQIVDIYHLLTAGNSNDNNLIKDKFIKRFRDFLTLNQYAKSADDKELLGRIHLVLQHTSNIPTYIQKIKEKCSYSLDMANVVFTTGHKSKGLEFDTVRILDDFVTELDNFRGHQLPTITVDEAEYNLLYVAVTRAKRCLLISTTLYYILLEAQEKFEYFASRRTFDSNNPLKCFFCGLLFSNEENPLVLMREEIKLSNSGIVAGGPICSNCATNPTFLPVVPRISLTFNVQIRRPIEDYSHQSIRRFVGNEVSRQSL